MMANKQKMFHKSCTYSIVFIFIVFTLVCGNCQSIKTMEEQIKDSILTNYSINQRPVNDSKDIVTVSMNMMFISMLNLIEKDQVLSSGSWIQLRWMDYRLKWDPDEYDGLDLIAVDPDQVWLPKLMIFNAVASDHVNIVDKDTGQILLESTGEVNLGLQILQSTQCALRIDYFPFDRQVCPFFFGFQNLPESIARLEITGTSIYSYNTTTQWDILDLTGNVSSGFIPNMTSKKRYDNVSVATFCLFLRRHPNYYIGTLIIPSTCLCLLAFMTFLAPPDCGERISVGVSMVLGLTVFQLLMSDLLPISNESSILSGYLSTNFIFVVLTVPLSLGNMNLAYGDRTRDLPRWKWYRRLFLEYLPTVLFIPSLSQRLSNIRRTNKVSPQPQQLQLEDLEQTNINGKANEEKTKVKGPDVTEKFDDYDHQEILLEARTLALVADRLVFIGLFCSLVVRVILLINSFSKQEDVPHLFTVE